jgi:hypothetical protein
MASDKLANQIALLAFSVYLSHAIACKPDGKKMFPIIFNPVDHTKKTDMEIVPKIVSILDDKLSLYA